MDLIIQFVGQTLVRAIPTFILVYLLYWYLNKFFFQPLGDVLEKRRQATEGTIERAEAMVAKAAEKTAEYEQALADTRAGIYKENEAARAKLMAQQAEVMEGARKTAAQTVASAREELAEQAAASRAALHAESERLAEQIATSLLAGRAA
ncbi:MAG: ATP synthase F0 subunit B [Bryobacterales bacterium]|nr:ATP synthase F0 subunit B [Bryobacterales bacterium]